MTQKSFFLRYQKLWLSLGWLLIATIITLSLIPPPPITLPSYSDKVAHLFAYFVVMGWFIQIYPHPISQNKLLISFILLGTLLEILQGFSGIREMDWMDALANSSGVFLAWGLGKTRFAWMLFYVERRLVYVK